MNTYYLDLGWRGGVIVVAESVEQAAKILKEKSYHGSCIEDLESKLNLLKSNEFYDFYGDT